ncbi:hypothetical protein MLAC_00010 [Mycobacterium lacus]|uniref:Uncharacterized protein n=1 Tax=Mycobacterium lacus TaxID=169765 RepID=A0A7I7NGT5_9MYCO|nr:hypothetical protein MLAC_00010 [Mycobacterium lacus]
MPGYSDYYPEAPGGRPRGRSIEPKPFNARKLGVDEAGLEPAYGKVPLNVVVMQQDYVRLNQLKRHPRVSCAACGSAPGRCGRSPPARTSSAWAEPSSDHCGSGYSEPAFR